MFTADMRARAVVLHISVLILVLMMCVISLDYFDLWWGFDTILGLKYSKKVNPAMEALSRPPPKCGLSRECPPEHFALYIRSGAANVVGPKICFEGKIIMSHVLNNVGGGLNIVVLNGETGEVNKYTYFDMQSGNENDILTYLKDIQPGMIVLVASFDDIAKKMTGEMREVFAGMGSSLIQSVKHRDSWVFAGLVGTQNKSVYEKLAINTKETNTFEGWPGVVEVGGCFRRIPPDGQ